MDDTNQINENKNEELNNIMGNLELGQDVAAIYTNSLLIKKEISKVIVGQDDVIDLLLISIFSNGHVLLEGVPGIAKTLLAKMLAKTLSVKFSRIQFTPDLMPTDITGTSVFNFKTSEFVFNKGPVFANLVLIDEINRSPAKTQAALFEVMEEKQITVDLNTFLFDYPFLVIATQNPIEHEGTYKLPEAQLDRFLFKIKMQYPNIDEEINILQRFKEDFDNSTSLTVTSVIDADTLKSCKQIIEKVYIKDELIKYIVEIIQKTREHKDLFLGASPRASLNILKSAKAYAAIKGRTYVSPDDIRFVSFYVLNHRLILSAEMELEGIGVEKVIEEILNSVEVPR